MRLLEDAEEFVATKQLRASFHSTALARPIDVVADALRRNVTCRCSIGAPEDRRRYQTRISWLLEQLPESNLAETMVHMAWDNGNKTCVSVRRLRNDENEGRVDGALPIAFELSRSFDLAQRFSGPKLFVEGVDSAVWTFCDSIARHLRAWQPRPVRREQEQSEPRAEEPADRMVVREASIPGGKVRFFDDGSIEHETAAGASWFRSFAELERSLRAKDALRPRQDPDNAGSHNGGNDNVPGPVTTAETLPTNDPHSIHGGS
jgi:hypothetical protein